MPEAAVDEAPTPTPPEPAVSASPVPQSAPSRVSEERVPSPTPEVAEPVLATGTVTFLLEPASLFVQTDAGIAGHRRAQVLALGPQLVKVGKGSQTWECTVPVRKGHTQYLVRQADRTCVPGR